MIREPLTFGIEEEVFIAEPERPTLRSLYYMSKLMARNFKYYYTHSASNFSRGKDLKHGLMSSVELSTAVHHDIAELIADLKQRRQDMNNASEGLIVPVGHLLNIVAPTNTAALQMHVGNTPDINRVYNNLLHFLPILCLFTINSPLAGAKRYGQSFRIGNSFAIGPIQDNNTIRFQDIIISKRLGTIELRVFDPCWDIDRVNWLANAVKAIAELDVQLNPNVNTYNMFRKRISKEGLLPEFLPLVSELKSIIDFPVNLITYTASDELADLYDKCGLISAYSAMDSGYRTGEFKVKKVNLKQKETIIKSVIGFVGYFIPRLPYYAWKGIIE